MNDIYLNCPRYQNSRFLIRKISRNDLNDLLEIYSDVKSVPFFNSDNCHGDNFYYTTEERMKEALNFWKYSYNNRWFVRFSIVDRSSNKVIGTIEVFLRKSFDSFDKTIVMRLDLKSEYEKEEDITSIISLFVPKIFDQFKSRTLITKAIPLASERIKALTSFGFVLSRRKLIGGEDNKEYSDYYKFCKK